MNVLDFLPATEELEVRVYQEWRKVLGHSFSAQHLDLGLAFPDLFSLIAEEEAAGPTTSNFFGSRTLSMAWNSSCTVAVLLSEALGGSWTRALCRVLSHAAPLR